MKQIFTYTIISLWLCIGIMSCTNKENLPTYTKPGIYYIGMDFSPISSIVTKGYDEDYNNFDLIYDPNQIYLHNINTGEYIEIPVVDNCTNSQDGTKCKGIRYKIEVKENQNATITPLNSEGNPYIPSGETIAKTLPVKNTEECYFSSLTEDEWALTKDQIIKNSLYDSEYTFFLRQKDINKEIYRSQLNLALHDLTVNSDLTLIRGCAGFNTLAFFYDQNDKDFDNNDFERIMGSKPETWYVKVYMGGSGFTDAYNLAKQQSNGTTEGGYYSTGDKGHFIEGNIDLNKYIAFSEQTYAITSSNIRQGWGYKTKTGNQLYTPVIEEEKIDVYILIKHWNNPGTTPDEQWLFNDMDALQTKVNITTITKKNHFYNIGLAIDIAQFKAAWEKEFGEGSTASGTTTRSLSGAPVREVTIPGAKVICDVY